MACRADQPCFGAFVLDQGVQADRGAVDAEIAIGDDVFGRAPKVFCDQPEPLVERQGRIVGRRKRFVEPDVAASIGEHEIGEGAARVDSPIDTRSASLPPFFVTEPLIDRPVFAWRRHLFRRPCGLNAVLTSFWHDPSRSMRSWESARPPRVLGRGTDSQDRMDRNTTVTGMG